MKAGFEKAATIPVENTMKAGLSLATTATGFESIRNQQNLADKDVQEQALGSAESSQDAKGFKGNKRLTNEVRLRVIPGIPKDVYKFSFEEVAEAELEWSATLIGVLIGKPISYNDRTDFMQRHRQIEQPKLYIKNNGILVMKFKSIKDRSWVLSNGPWLIDGHKSLILQEWSTGMSTDWESFKSVPLWVKILDIDPIFLSSKNILEVIGNMIGKPISVDHMTKDVEKLSYACLLVEVTLEESKRKEVVLQSYNGKVYKHKVEFEWIPWNCGTCNAFGHSPRFCSRNEVAKNEPIQGNYDQKCNKGMVAITYKEKAAVIYKEMGAANYKNVTAAVGAATYKDVAAAVGSTGLERNDSAKATAKAPASFQDKTYRGISKQPPAGNNMTWRQKPVQ